MNVILFHTHQKQEVLPKICKANEQAVCIKRRQGCKKIKQTLHVFDQHEEVYKVSYITTFLKRERNGGYVTQNLTEL